jgi:putative two-component system response regulator
MTPDKTEILQSKILIVDDKPVNVLLLEQMLEAAAFENVYSTTDSRQVVSLHEQHSFDLILLDIRMPHMTGIQVMEALSTTIAHDFVPILVLTAQTDEETRTKALTAGANDFLTKPFKQWEVLLRINNMLRTRLFYKDQRMRGDELEEKVRERTQDLRRTQLKIVQRLGRASEYRDNETGAHIMRMSKSCQLLALAAGLDAKHAERILHASPMHDVGKIGIRDTILLKPGKLDADEFEIMKTHTTIGANIIGNHSSKLLGLAHQIALYNHEKWDGSGYPHGLKGEKIPIEARIAAVCDVFDALTSARPYKEAWPVDKAVTLIKESAGIHFDPGLVGPFLDLFPDVVALRQQFPDDEEIIEPEEDQKDPFIDFHI